MRKSLLQFITVILAFMLCIVAAQTQEPTLAPEHKKLGFWVGTWKVEADAKPNPLFPQGKYFATMTGEWFQGNFHVVCRYKWTGAMGPYSELDILGYDPTARAYYIYVIDGFGGNHVFTGTVKENVWTYICDMKVDEKPVKFRWSVVEVSPTVITWKSEIWMDGGPWILAGEAKATKM